MKSLKDLEIGHSGVVKSLNMQGALLRRIMDMGVTKGTKITLRKYAPLGDPMEFIVRGYELSIRKEDAANIMIEEV